MVVAGESSRALQPCLVRSRTASPGIPARKQVWWNESQQKWVGNDVPDFKADSDPKDHMGPFIMNPEGVGRLFVPIGAVADGPFPEHYEPTESPIKNPLHPNQSNNPIAKRFKSDMDKYGTVEEGFNIICTTYRLTEHYHYWTKNNPMNVQLVPEPFVEIPAELADQMGIRGSENVKVTSARAELHRRSHGHQAHQGDDDRRQEDLPDRHSHSLGIPRHRRRRRQNREDAGQLLSPAVIDPNAYTPEFKGFLVKLEKA